MALHGMIFDIDGRVVFLGVLSGGTPADLLLESGACGVWRDTGHLYADLDHALEIAALAAAAAH